MIEYGTVISNHLSAFLFLVGSYCGESSALSLRRLEFYSIDPLLAPEIYFTIQRRVVTVKYEVRVQR